MKHLYTLILLLLLTFSHSFSQTKKLLTNEETIKIKINTLVNRSKNLSVQEAQNNLQEALYLSKGLNDSFLIANTSVAVAKLYSIQKDYAAAEVNMLRAIQEYRDLKNKEYLGIAYREYAQLFILQGKYSRAKDYLDLAESIFEEEELPLNKAYVLKEKGRIAYEEGDYITAIEVINLAIEDLSDSPDKYPYAHALYLIGKSHFANFNYEFAEKNVQRSFEISKRYKYKNLQADTALLLSQVSSQLNDDKKAVRYLTISNEINKELSLNSKNISLDEEALRKLEEKDEVITNLSEVNLQQEKDIKLNTLITLLSIAFITILSLLTLSLYKNNKIRDKANVLLLKQRDELKEAKEKAEKATRAKAQFLSTITHELRTPLYAVTGLTNLLLGENPTKEQKQHLNSLKFSGDYLLSLINNILDLNKLEANKAGLRVDKFNLKKRILEVITALNYSANKSNVNVHFEFDDQIPNLLNGDSIKLSQVLINLIGNAIKFTKNGDIWVRVIKNSESSEATNLRIEIEDNGLGISKEQQELIFENFSQGSLDINREFGGTGLGLSITKQILKLMGSSIKLESEIGKGSKFYFDIVFEIPEIQEGTPEIIPLEDIKKLTMPSDGQENLKDSEAISASKTIEDSPTKIESLRLDNRHILVVEDNKINQMITRKILEKNGATCVVADNGEKAVAVCNELEFDLVLMDIHMPGIGGIEATKQIREFNSTLPIIALTAVTLEDDGKAFYDNGFSAIIPKPFKQEEFFETIKLALNAADKPLT